MFSGVSFWDMDFWDVGDWGLGFLDFLDFLDFSIFFVKNFFFFELDYGVFTFGFGVHFFFSLGFEIFKY